MDDSVITALFDAAAQVRLRAHAPYSGFAVGAALRADDGRSYAGCNVENAAYPSGTCAEQAAIAAMIAGGARKIEALAVVADGPRPLTPCGACRQRIREFAGSLQMPIVAVSLDKDLKIERLNRYPFDFLLPNSFGPENLGK